MTDLQYFRLASYNCFRWINGKECCLRLLSFSGFSVGFCINEERRLSVTNYSSENNLPTFRLNAPVVIRAKVKEVRTKTLLFIATLLRIHVIGGQRSVRIAPPSLPPHHSDPAARDFQSSIPVEALL